MTIPLPADLPTGYVDGTFVRAAADSADADRTPDGVPITDLTITFTPTSPTHTATTEPAALIVKDTRTCTTDTNGDLLDETGTPGVWLVAGAWIVNYSTSSPGVRIKAHSINVTAEHTETTPLHLSLAYPPPGAGLEPSEYAVLSSRIDNLELGVTSWTDVTDKPTTFPPSGHTHPWIEVTDKPNTGWRDISGLLRDGWAPAVPGRCRAIHTGDTVTIALYLDGAAATSDTPLVLATDLGPEWVGFDVTSMWSTPDGFTTGAAVIYSGSGSGNVRMFNSAVGKSGVFVSFTFAAPAPPATPYPGTPA